MGDALVQYLYRQCLLRKEVPDRANGIFQMAWIPEHLARPGKVLKVKIRDTDEWDDGWYVVRVSSHMESEYSLRSERYYKGRSEASDRTDWPKLKLKDKVKPKKKEE